MKKISYIISALAFLFLYACEPQKDVAPDLGSAPSGDFTIDNSDPNYIVFTYTGEDAFLYSWNFGDFQSTVELSNKVTHYFPFAGDYKVICNISGKGGSKTIEKTVNVPTENLTGLVNAPIFKELTNAGEGRTWVYATDYSGEHHLDWITYPAYWFMTDAVNDDDGINWTKAWWDPYGDEGISTPGVLNEMKFDLDGAANYTFYETGSGQGLHGAFSISPSDSILTIFNAHIPDYNTLDPWGEPLLDPEVVATNQYKIVFISDDELILWQDQTAKNPDNFDYGWCWVFKRKGFVYP